MAHPYGFDPAGAGRHRPGAASFGSSAVGRGVPAARAPLPELPYDPPELGRNYWLLDGALSHPAQVRERCLTRTDWTFGAPYRPESWPGRRIVPALTAAEMAPIEAWVREVAGAERLWVQRSPEGGRLDHNCVQVVGGRESRARPHTDSLALCRYAGVLYLSPDAPEDAGTSFYRQRLADGRPGGNRVVAPHANLVEALGTRFVPPDSFVEDVRVANRFNRLLVYNAALIHSATAYFGAELAGARMATVFFWMA
jgi:hypothetical protein